MRQLVRRLCRYAFGLIAAWAFHATAAAQDLEPRRWTHLPVNLSVVGLGSGFADGDIYFDPVLNVEDAKLDGYSVGISYVHSFEWLGRSARIDFSVPYARFEWSGLLNGAPAEVTRQGFADPSVRISMNFIGAPPLKGQPFQAYRTANRVHTTVGGAVGVLVPVGEYFEDKLLNLGSNRWIARPQLGVLHERGPWQFELTGSVLLFGDNDEFFMNSVREQDPLWLLQAHIIRSFRPGLWASLSSGYGWGGESTINSIAKQDDGRVRYWALSLGVPINSHQGLKFAYVSSRTNTLTGADLNTFTVAWSLAFSR